MSRQQQIEAGVAHLRKDKALRKIVDAVGPFTLRPERNRFSILVQAIISQQISAAAARKIRGRLDALLEPEGMSPENLAAMAPSDLQSSGLSRQKANYILDLAQKTLDGLVSLKRIGRLSDEAVIEMLTQVKGIGRLRMPRIHFILSNRPMPDSMLRNFLTTPNFTVRPHD